MSLTKGAAIAYAVAALGAAAFQIALAAGAPWGAYAMGGASPGELPPAGRVGALGQAVLLIAMATVTLVRASLVVRGARRIPHRLMWIVVAITAMSLILNLITPSACERALWTPTLLLMLVCSLVVALSERPRPAS